MVDYYEQVKILYKKSDWTEDEIRQHIDEVVDNISKRRPEYSEEQIVKALKRKIFTERKRVISDVGGTDMLIVIMYAGTPFNWVQSRIDKIEEFIDSEGLEKAIATGRVKIDEWTPDGKPKKKTYLYYWDKNSAGGENKLKGKKLPDESYLRSIGGIASVDGSEYKKFVMTISGDFANPDSQYFKKLTKDKLLRAEVKIKDESDDMFQLNAKASTNLYSSVMDEDFDISKEDFIDIFGDMYIGLDEVEEWFEETVEEDGKVKFINIDWFGDHSRGTRDTYTSIGTVVNIEPPTDNSSARVHIDSMERGLFDDDGNELQPFLCWWGDNVPLEFGNGSEVAVFGQIQQSERKESEEYTGEFQQVHYQVNGVHIFELEEKEVVELPDDTNVTSEDFVPDIDDLDVEELSEDEIKELELDEVDI